MNDTIVTVVNRSSQVVTATADGQHYSFAPHAQIPMPQWKALICRRQAPLMGSEDYYRPGSKQFLLAIKELGHDCSPLEQSDALEAFDPATMDPSVTKRTLIGRKRGKADAPDLRSAPSPDATFNAND